MSTTAASNVNVKIAIDAQGNASKVVQQTRGELDAMGKSAEAATGQAAGGMARYATIAQQSASRIGGAMSAVNAVIGGTNPTLQKVQQSFTAAGAVAATIPGPIGLAAAAAVGLGVAVYKFATAADEAEAKSRFLRGGAGADDMAKNIGISAEAVAQLTVELEDLRASGLAPTADLLNEVRLEAVAMGGDGEKAINSYVKAYQGGFNALRAAQGQLGNMGIGTLETLTAQLGLTRELVGLDKEGIDLKAEAKDVLDREARLRADETLAIESQIRLQGEIAQMNVSVERNEKEAQLERVNRRLDEIELERKANADRAANITRRRQEEKEAAAAAAEATANEKAGKERIAQLQIRMAGATDLATKQAIGQNIIAEQYKQLKIDQLALAERAFSLTAAQLNAETEALETRRLQIAAAAEAQAKALADERKRKAEAAASKNRERIQAETDATLKLAQAGLEVSEAKSKDPLLDPEVIAQKLNVIGIEEDAAIAAAKRRVNTVNGREIEIRAIEMAAAKKRADLETAERKRREENARDVITIKREQFESELQAEIETQAKIDELSKAATARDIEAMRRRGDIHDATLLEIQAAEAQTAANIEKINRDLAVKLTGIDAESDVAQKQRQLANAQVLAEQAQLASKIADANAKEAEAQNTAIDKQVSSIERITAGAAQAGGLGDFAKSAAAVATNVQKGALAFKAYNAAAAASNIGDMTKANEGLSTAIDGTIEASGAAAASFVDDEKTKAAILAVTETAASIAAFATGNVSGGIAHAASAAIYAGVAGGAIGGAAGAGAAGAGTGGATTGGGGEVTGATGAAGAGGGGMTQVFNFNRGFVIGSAQEVGKGINGTLRSVNGTGYDRRKAA